jgi:hypothetical protein
MRIASSAPTGLFLATLILSVLTYCPAIAYKDELAKNAATSGKSSQSTKPGQNAKPSQNAKPMQGKASSTQLSGRVEIKDISPSNNFNLQSQGLGSVLAPFPRGPLSNLSGLQAVQTPTMHQKLFASASQSANIMPMLPSGNLSLSSLSSSSLPPPLALRGMQIPRLNSVHMLLYGRARLCCGRGLVPGTSPNRAPYYRATPEIDPTIAAPPLLGRLPYTDLRLGVLGPGHQAKPVVRNDLIPLVAGVPITEMKTPMAPANIEAELESERDSQEMVIAWEAWHKRVSGAIYERWTSTHPRPGSARLKITITKHGDVDVSILTSSGDQRFDDDLLAQVKQIERAPVLQFPEHSTRHAMTIGIKCTASPTVSSGYGWKKDDYERIKVEN